MYLRLHSLFIKTYSRWRTDMNSRKFVFWIIQRVFGSALLLFGLNSLFSFLPLPKHEGYAKLFFEVLAESTYILPIITVVQIGSGAALWMNRFVPLALILIFPI